MVWCDYKLNRESRSERDRAFRGGLAALFLIFLSAWLFHVRKKNLESIEWVLLKITPPREIQKTPKAMEQIFAAFNQTYSFGAKFRDKYFVTPFSKSTLNRIK